MLVVAASMASGAAMAQSAPPSASVAEEGIKAEKDERLARAPAPAPAAAPDDAAVMGRMLAATDTAVPIADLDDALVTTGSVAPEARQAAHGFPSAAEESTSDALAVMASLPSPSPAARAMPDMLSAAAERSFDASRAGVAAGQAGRILSSVKLRAKPDNAAGIVGVLAAETAVTVLRCDYWCEVEAGPKRGFVFKKFVDGSPPSSGERAAEKQEP